MACTSLSLSNTAAQFELRAQQGKYTNKGTSRLHPKICVIKRMGGRYSGLPILVVRTAIRTSTAATFESVADCRWYGTPRRVLPGSCRNPCCSHRRRLAARCSRRRESVVVLILRYLVARHVEAAGVRQVIYVECVLQTEAVRDLRLLHEGSIGPLLERLPEDVALTGREGCSHKDRTSGTAPFRPPAGSNGIVKQEEFSA